MVATPETALPLVGLQRFVKAMRPLASCAARTDLPPPISVIAIGLAGKSTGTIA
jgi:hypothetical protein